MEEDIQIKQNFLRNEVIEKGYSADLFVNFLSEKKTQNADDLHSYTLEELKSIVEEFRQIYKDENSDTKSQKDNFDVTSNLNQSIYSTITPTQSQFEEIITCKKMTKTPLTEDDKLKITISDPELNKGGFFSSSYHTYLISTPSINSNVRRRFSDFVWLRETLSEQYPSVFIPPIPDKKLMEKTSEQLANKRIRYLQKFLDAIVKNNVLKSTKILFTFLTVEDKDEFVKLKSFYSKLPSPTILKDFENLEGIIDLKITPELDAKAKLINVTTNTYEDLLNQLNESFKYLLVEMETVSVRLKEISNIFYNIYQCSEISQDVPDTVNTYKMMNHLTGNWGKIYDSQSKVIKEEFREFFKYVKREMASFKELIVEYQGSKKNFISYDTRLRNRKENLFSYGNVDKWELNPEEINILDREELLKNKEFALSKMLYKESTYCTSLKRNYAYNLTQLIHEYNLYQKNLSRRYKNHFLSLSAKHTSLLSDIFSMVKLLTLNC